MQTVAWRCKEGAILRYPECLEVPLVTKKHGTSQGCTSSEGGQCFVLKCSVCMFYAQYPRREREEKTSLDPVTVVRGNSWSISCK